MTGLFTSKITSDNKVEFWQFGIICLVVGLVNWNSVFGLETLIKDDFARYSSLANGIYPVWMYKFSTFGTYIQLRMYDLLLISPKIARLVQLLIFQIPLSLSFFFLCKGIFKLPTIIAIAAAILPNILSGQEAIPAFINGSYNVQGFLMALLSLILGAVFLRKTTRRRSVVLLLALFFYMLSLDVMEQSVFLLIPFLYVFFISLGTRRNKVLISLAFVFLASLKIVWVKLHPRAMHEIPLLSFADVLQRIKYYWSTVDPFFGLVKSTNATLFYSSLLVLIILICFFISYKDRNNSTINGTENLFVSEKTHFIPIFSLLLMSCSIAPFIFLSPFVASRYAYISSYGYNLLLLYSINEIGKFLIRKQRYQQIVSFLLITLILSISGINRITTLDSRFSLKNRYFSDIKKELSKHDFPLASQIVIVDGSSTKSVLTKSLGTAGFWTWSSGYLQHLTGRNDIQGIMPYEVSFYDPFNPNGRSSYADNLRMTGLDLKEPIFLFRKNGEILVQMKYGLQWLGKGDGVEWAIYEFDQFSGVGAPLLTGLGTLSYDQEKVNLMLEKGIKKGEILWD